MADNSKKSIDDFMTSAKKTLNDNTPEAQQQVQTEHQKKYAAQEKQILELYNNSIAPIVKAISRLPEKDGKRFVCQVEIGNDSDDMPELNVRVYYWVSPKQVEVLNFIATTEYRPPLRTPVFWYVFDPTQKVAATPRKGMNSEGFTTAAKILGEWFAEVVPARVGELEKELTNAAPGPDKVQFKRPEARPSPIASTPPATEKKKRGFFGRFRK
jgi:hypothetical protein